MADNDLLSLIGAVAASGPKPAAFMPQGAPTDADNLQGVFNQAFGAGFDPLNSQNFPTWFPEVPPEAKNQDLNSDNPAKPGGALEVLSVTQIQGPPGGQVPCGTRRYAVRGQILGG